MTYSDQDLVEPTILTLPGLDNSAPDHWQSHWEKDLPNCRRVELGQWHQPHRNSWVTKLNLAIRQIDGPVVLVAHSLSCHLVAWWAALERPAFAEHVIGALLVAPPELDSGDVDQRLLGFAPTPHSILPFPSIVAASRDDPYIPFSRARRLATLWGSRFADAGTVGHINAQSDIGDWPFGKFLLHRLLTSGHSARNRQAEVITPVNAVPQTEIHPSLYS
jgi:hypothetical protein